MEVIEVISKMSFVPISVLGPRFNSSKYFKYVCGLKLSPALNLSQNPIFEMASIYLLSVIRIKPITINR